MSVTNRSFGFRDVAARVDQLPGVLRFDQTFAHGSMRLGLYKPVGLDAQRPHDQDEIYIIASGSGDFVTDSGRTQFVQNDALFVAAGAQHRFENFSEDFAAWVVFWGPPGGES